MWPQIQNRLPTTLDNISIVDREGQSFSKTNKESIYIRLNNPTFNRNIGKYNLPHTWVGFLVNTPGPMRT